MGFAIRRLVSLTLLAVGLLLFYGNAWAGLFLWEVTSNSNKVYLFGSIHLAKPSMYPLPAPVEKAFADSAKLVVETNPNELEQIELQQKLLSEGMYPGNETLDSHVDKKLLMELKEYLQQHNIPYATLAKFKPGLVGLNLTIMRLVQMGFKPELGIDKYFMDKAKSLKKPILQLETPGEQIDLLLGLPNDSLMLQYTLASMGQLEKMMNQMVSAWEQGDTKTIKQLMVDEMVKEYPETREVMAKFIDDRNFRMADKISGFLSDKEPHFVVVGAGHLVGKQGLPSLLLAKGFKVKQL